MTAERVATLTAAAYEQASGWEAADLHPAAAVAAADGAALMVRNAVGDEVPITPMAGMGPMDDMMSGMHSPQVSEAGRPSSRRSRSTAR